MAQKKDIKLSEKALGLIIRHLNCYSPKDVEFILAALNIILKQSISFDGSLEKLELCDFQQKMSKINEKETRRKNDGVYYTPKDVTEYIILNSYLNYLSQSIEQVFSATECVNKIQSLDKSAIIDAKIFDPTCGTAEFLISAYEIKLQLLDVYSDCDVVRVISSMYGNDIARESILLSKVRLFFTSINTLKDKTLAVDIASVLNSNFTNEDFIIKDNIEEKYDIVVGNPPYVEYRNLQIIPKTRYGNAYADVLQNAVASLNEKGVIGFIIPLSFVSTKRMEKIRNYAYDNLQKMFTLNFADRPDCLFDGVHQKLTIIIGNKGKDVCKIYSSSYYHWYSSERNNLLSNCKVYPVSKTDCYIPKIGNPIEAGIFEKISSVSGIPLSDFIQKKTNSCIYLNMRGCFWMKAFTFNPGSNEYKSLFCTKEQQSYIFSILNSNLFFLYWSIVSDCWHITGKDLLNFKVPIENVDFAKFDKIASKIEQKLEKTKKYIGSKQTEYEYKHKECKIEIDEIDEALKDVYKLTSEEIIYLKNYKLKYRMSNEKL